jgi:hypothetical protein
MGVMGGCMDRWMDGWMDGGMNVYPRFRYKAEVKQKM